jgi:predicted phosphodiesterase
MRLALLADLHANLFALEAVLHDVNACEADYIVCLGDIVGYGAQPRQCTEFLRRLNCITVMGNHDFYTTSPSIDPVLRDPESLKNPVWAGIQHARNELTKKDLAWLYALPSLCTIDGGLIAHAALHDLDQWPYLRNYQDAKPTLDILKNRLGFFGHTHRQNIFHHPTDPAPEELEENTFHLPDDTGYAITVGSVGQPRDPGTAAAWTLWNPDERIVTFRRVSYRTKPAASAILEAGLPAGSALRLLA